MEVRRQLAGIISLYHMSLDLHAWRQAFLPPEPLISPKSYLPYNFYAHWLYPNIVSKTTFLTSLSYRSHSTHVVIYIILLFPVAPSKAKILTCYANRLSSLSFIKQETPKGKDFSLFAHFTYFMYPKQYLTHSR